MQSFYKGLRCHLTSSNVSKISGLRGFIASVGSPLKSETKCSSPLESSAYHRRSCASSTCRIHGVGISKWGAFGPAFTTRSMTTDAHPREPVSGSTNDIAPPHIKFKRLDKTARHIMQIIDKEQVQAVKEHRDFPDIQPGDTVQLKVEVPDNKRRVQTLKGTVIARRNAGLHSTFRIRRMLAGVGVESVYPLYSPNIKEMKVLNKNKARRAKLYYLRDRKNALKKQ
ncbi:50S ribosomal protein L19, chloroplastic-like [Papaver somniferum]|uniref:50S ribosomal protein L19, chloroplastic-like n=1 Tax=Papaver somniferum TaxID=3469 RepID=UPI000E6F6B55|nr:50S ribosomal protein L19, chloroplastic-like [Papaver somniferum]XP_026431575.1 50S ribosomal protein L19, chloroplastic-like [Papaver somniferum]